MALELTREPICCAVSIYHPLAQKQRLCIEDLYGENLMLTRRNWSKYIDLLRDDLWEHHPQIHIVDFDFFSAQVFNQCEHGDALLMAIPQWAHIHPLLKIIPVEWNHSIPFGLLHAPSPSPAIKEFLAAAAKMFGVIAT